ncbi:carbon-nitrogen hydrolase family protein [Butyricicoccus faecihominis]|uniref:carbon-nitrogen hydrolase family protein n=1 Tax=Butyricicoccus faecihominis TaxID=1712515 RepID=UPI00247A6761|nr:carbon-nitrogen hydrolase family protein [Butyricicoccus faecihominis]MCQ5129072.1 carbon-nitrogen hydrolase family protein [Butyricicoccus faecihominis]
MTNPVVNIAVVNFKTVWGDKNANLERICAYAEQAALCGADIIVLPELALTGYDDEADKPLHQKMQTLLAETIPGPATDRVSEIAKRTGAYILFGMPEVDRDDPSVTRNSAAICLPDGGVRSFRKVHMPAGEASWARRGDEPLFLDTPFGVIGVGICYDSYKFPELVRMTKARGGQLFINVTALPFEDILPNVNREDLESMALADSIYLASANLVGLDLYKHFMGGSSVLGPGETVGETAYYAGYPFGDPAGQQPGVFLAAIDLSLAESECCHTRRLFTAGPEGQAPGWRPAIYREMCDTVLNDPDWQRRVRAH